MNTVAWTSLYSHATSMYSLYNAASIAYPNTMRNTSPNEDSSCQYDISLLDAGVCGSIRKSRLL